MQQQFSNGWRHFCFDVDWLILWRCFYILKVGCCILQKSFLFLFFRYHTRICLSTNHIYATVCFWVLHATYTVNRTATEEGVWSVIWSVRQSGFPDATIRDGKETSGCPIDCKRCWSCCGMHLFSAWCSPSLESKCVLARRCESPWLSRTLFFLQSLSKLLTFL